MKEQIVEILNLSNRVVYNMTFDDITFEITPLHSDYQPALNRIFQPEFQTHPDITRRTACRLVHLHQVVAPTIKIAMLTPQHWTSSTFEQVFESAGIQICYELWDEFVEPMNRSRSLFFVPITPRQNGHVHTRMDGTYMLHRE